MSDPVVPAAPAEPVAAAPTPEAPAEPTPAVPESPWSDPKVAEAEITKLRRENAAARTTAKENAANEARAALTQEFGKILGLVKDDEPVDPAELTKQISASQAEAQRARVELAVFRNAAAVQGDPSALLDSASFLAKIAGLDPSDTAAVTAAIKEAVETNPRLGVAPAAPKAPEPIPGQGATGGPTAPAQLGAADLERMAPEQIVEARQKGQLADLLAGKR